MVYDKLPKEMNCSGCGACVNVCPVNAIQMEYSKDTGFIVPSIQKETCVDCGLCTKTCPSLHPKFENVTEPKFYSFCADDATRRVSSSGGMFSVIAEHVLAQGGYVCGAAFDENMQLRHRIISNPEELEPLRGSKYLQSDVNDCYKQIKTLLNEGKKVFFCGTPCQVAGLYNVVRTRHENLITADLLCHGTPSQKFFDAYLKDVSGGKKPVDALFRSKRFGWAYRGLIVKFADGTEHVGTNIAEEKDPYVIAFIKNMMMRFTCYDCKFNDYPRQGDFTIGDLWHSDMLDPKSNDRKGTSFVFMNNAKAESLFTELCESAKYYNEIHVEDYSKIPNRVRAKEHAHPARRRFLNLLKTKTFTEAYKQAYNEHYDIGLVGVMGNENIGSILTYYGLYHTLTEMGYSVLPIERPLDAPLKVSDKAKAFSKKWLPAYAQFVQCETIDDMRALNDKCDQFVVGSDQIYLAGMSRKRNHCYFLQWADDRKNKIAYASSFGGAGARGSEEYYQWLKYFLNRFSFVSSREDDGVALANQKLKLAKPAQWVIDPVFLCNPKKYHVLANTFKRERKKPIIGSYILIPRPAINDLLKKTHAHFPDCDVEVIGSKEMIGKATVQKQQSALAEYQHFDSFPVGHTLEIIKNCQFFVTDSFHGVCFSIIFKKDFLVVPRDFHDRFHSLLDRIGLSDRIIKGDHSNLTEAHFKPIDYGMVYKKLNAETDRCRKLLAEALQNRPQFSYSDRDVLMKYINTQNDSIQHLETQIAQMQTMLTALQSRLPAAEVTEITSFEEVSASDD